MPTKLEDYIKLTQQDRQRHLDLVLPCDLRGGNSAHFRGILAHYLNTNVAAIDAVVHLCHACNNGGCSNPKHLYWGTPKENIHDAMECGANHMVMQNMIRKWGKTKALEILAENRKTTGITTGNMIWITNGIEESRIIKTASIPEGWWRGRSPTSQKTRKIRSEYAHSRTRDSSGRFF